MELPDFPVEAIPPFFFGLGFVLTGIWMALHAYRTPGDWVTLRGGTARKSFAYAAAALLASVGLLAIPLVYEEVSRPRPTITDVMVAGNKAAIQGRVRHKITLGTLPPSHYLVFDDGLRVKVNAQVYEHVRERTTERLYVDRAAIQNLER
jgi:hypothetical protein